MSKNQDKYQIIISIVVAILIFGFQYLIKRQVDSTDKRIESNIALITKVDDRLREIEKKYEQLGGPKDPLFDKVKKIELDIEKIKNGKK